MKTRLPTIVITLLALLASSSRASAQSSAFTYQVQSAQSVTVPNNANTRLDAVNPNQDHALGLNDTLTLIWDGSNWIQISETEYGPP